MRISDWSSDVCSSDLKHDARDAAAAVPREIARDLGAAHRMRDDGHAIEVQPVDDGREIARQRIMVIAASRIGRTAVTAPVIGARAIDRQSTRLNSRHYCAARLPLSPWKNTT